PSSSRSGGSILGDKTRMERLSTQDAAFIRPSPSSGTLGGVAGRTHEIIVLCEAAGYDRILVETVGVGQSELAVDRMTDLFLLLMIAGTGDELQGIKRGIMEAADIIAINKADGGQQERSERTRAELKRAVAMLPTRPSGRRAEVVLCSALQESGIDELRALIEEFGEQDRRSGGLEERRSQQRTHWLQVAIDEALRAEFHNDPSVQEELERLGVAAREGQVSPFQAARRLIARFRKGGAPPP
ncbi:MAG TPA: methylmalonyl Co-A mutase-associated GTPase MeaB, partial [Flavobacteriales bacterium]|nr:methylmalonyl Co-A mutase-associated GTPase MeaB [Flavobacteriales bacterium]